MIPQEDLDAATIDDLSDLLQAVQETLARKAAVANIPQQVMHLADEYRRSGGDMDALLALIEDPAAPLLSKEEAPPT